jgi:transposase, IS30 family
MGKKYSHLSAVERGELSGYLKEGISLRGIALRLGRSASTVSRELRRNSKKTKVWVGGYDASRADSLALRRRRWDCRFKLARQSGLRSLVLDRLAMGWSPEQVAGRLAIENGGTPLLSHESIYRYIYFRVSQKDFLNRLLPRSKFRRGWYRRGRRGPLSYLPGRIPVSERGIASAGDWEADIVMFSDKRSNILVLLERASRRMEVRFQPDRTAIRVASNIASVLAGFPAGLRRSISFDNGPEFFNHLSLHGTVSATYFCDFRSPWQKGAVENGNGRLRRDLPLRTDVSRLDADAIAAIQLKHNSTPRKCLGWKTPDEVFSELAVALQL